MLYTRTLKFNHEENSIKGSALRLLVTLKDAGIKCWLVGGCVRDLLLGLKPKDYDICFKGTPEQLIGCVKANSLTYDIIETGLKHGTVTVYDRNSKQGFECTMLRTESEYKDGRHPDMVEPADSLEMDLARRDFTVNSFAYDPCTETVFSIDEGYFNDLKFGIIRAVGDPVKRFNEDALRMLRALRFMAQLNFSIEPRTYEAICKCSSLISRISKERIRDEMTKILLSDMPQVLELFVLSGLEEPALNGNILSRMLYCPHDNPYHYTDVFHHTMDVIKACPRKFNVRWAALLHDCGKPSVKALKPGTENHYRYIGHANQSCLISEGLLDTLKFSNIQKTIILKFVKHHDDKLAEMGNKKFKQFIVEIGEENMLDFISLCQADSISHNLDRSFSFAIEGLNATKERFIKITETNPQPLRIKDLDINGNDLVELGLKGKEIGDMLNHLLSRVLEKPELNTKSRLIDIAKEGIR